ncbi:related to eukaryotic translation initiation factor EIF-2B subunit 3 [Cephalotrichum gorgonifer]|uniref:Translation initiation factor eIF2B subunit gamma n=1 Tax=Cephalotrichum gorgonifer TaxID=2041049 RepID=A0AAE8N3P8_9PEZI|nr:related to eukaryotic translation initiation factor EIF-2B subunit 3 [Cephalotrichum gorgonifer]
MPHAISAPAPGLQAIILCGPGSSFPTFTANPDENPKALLPIANRPMVWYPIDFCYRMGITDITLICPPTALKAITTALNTNPYLTALPLPRPGVLAPEDLDQNTGTAEILRLPEVRDLVKSDFLILPCDLVCELAGEKFLQAWMTTAASLSYVLGDKRLAGEDVPPYNGGLGVWYDTKTENPIKGEEKDFIATTPLPQTAAIPPKGSLIPHVSKLVYSMPSSSLSDLMEDRAGLPVRHGLIRNHPRVRMLTTLRDAHIYIFPRWIVDFAAKNDRLDSIGEDITGWWAKAGWEKGLADKLKLDEVFKELDAAGARRTSADDTYPSRTVSPSGDGNGTSDTAAGAEADTRIAAKDVPPILAYIHPNEPSAPVLRRVDTARLLLSVTLQLAKIPSVEEVGAEAASPFAHPRKVAYPEGVKSRTTITKGDTLIAEHVTIEEKTSIKESAVGAHCQIKEGAKLLQCLLMDGVVIGKGCKLTRCILGKRCVIGDGCVLTDCEVQENLIVEKDTDAKDEKLMSSEGLEATEEEMNEFLEDDEVIL